MTDGANISDDPLWFKDAIIYQLHVKTFFDANNDGYGDFSGLIEKLDYVQDLGVNCIWILPFYPSPLRDDGYDIADYVSINPLYGGMDDARTFIKEAHKRGLRVMTELVINHTSDQHPWFQRARMSPAGSDERNFYVWSDTDTKFSDARIIFTDTETSNWTWDPIAKQYYWHRFFHHQPDLNFDNPQVIEEVLKVMDYWMDLGVDGVRLDAIPYLIARDGTNCENLPETHEILKKFRHALDEKYKNRIFLAEANQWPADVIEYFGDGDECHMAYHFPLMPRIFMAVHQEDRYPIVEIMRQTPKIPENCQWAIFLRNHDELTLEMVTDEERDYMYNAYASDPVMRCNVGIRRRLASLLEYSRPKIELLNSLLLSMPGTPIIYYGDEIGMGDNIYLGDRNGVRTPMQWSSDRNGGFSRAPFSRLYSPPIMDPVTGFQAVNVEAQQLDRSSLLHWMRNIIRLRSQYQVFGRGDIRFLESENRKVLTYIRSHDGQKVMCVANLSRYPQSAEVDLSEFEGTVPQEMFGLGRFHRIGTEPYILTLAPHSFYWLLLESNSADNAATLSGGTESQLCIYPSSADQLPLCTLDLRDGWRSSIMSDSFREELEARLLPEYVRRTSWLGSRSETVEKVRISHLVNLGNEKELIALAIVDVIHENGDVDKCSMSLSLVSKEQVFEMLEKSPELVMATINTEKGEFVLYNAFEDARFRAGLLELISEEREIKDGGVTLCGVKTPQFDTIIGDAKVSSFKSNRVQKGHFNTFVKYEDKLYLKAYRVIDSGAQHEWVVGKFLTESGKFPFSPKTAGCISLCDENGESSTVALLMEAVPNQGDGWTYSLEELRRFFDRASSNPHMLESVSELTRDLEKLPPGSCPELIPEEIYQLLGSYVRHAAALGARTAELHLSLASAVSETGTSSSLGKEKLTREEARSMIKSTRRAANKTLDGLVRHVDSLTHLGADLADRALELVERREQILNTIDAFPADDDSLVKMSLHGNFHLGQVLYTDDSFWVLDFRGEPFRTAEERASKFSPLKDVAGMLRSFSYAVYLSFFMHTRETEQDMESFLPWARICESWIRNMFLNEYLAVAKSGDFLPSDEKTISAVLEYFLMEKALYELRFEQVHRPDWLKVAVFSLLEHLRRSQPSLD